MAYAGRGSRTEYAVCRMPYAVCRMPGGGLVPSNLDSQKLGGELQNDYGSLRGVGGVRRLAARPGSVMDQK